MIRTGPLTIVFALRCLTRVPVHYDIDSLRRCSLRLDFKRLTQTVTVLFGNEKACWGELRLSAQSQSSPLFKFLVMTWGCWTSVDSVALRQAKLPGECFSAAWWRLMENHTCPKIDDECRLKYVLPNLSTVYGWYLPSQDQYAISR